MQKLTDNILIICWCLNSNYLRTIVVQNRLMCLICLETYFIIRGHITGIKSYDIELHFLKTEMNGSGKMST